MDEDIRDEERKRELALGSDDTPIYPHLPFVNKTHFRRDKGKPQGFCHGIIIEEGELNTRVDWEPEELPFLKGDIQHLLDHELNGMEGFWTVRFLNDDLAFRGVTYDDGFRSVFRFRTLEFMIRPLSENNNGGAFGPKNLKLGHIDAMRCLTAVMDKSGTSPQVAPQKGRGYAVNQHGCLKRIPFEWKVDRGHQAAINRQVLLWRQKAVGGYDTWRRLEREQKDRKTTAELWRAGRTEQVQASSPPHVPEAPGPTSPLQLPVFPAQRPGFLPQPPLYAGNTQPYQTYPSQGTTDTGYGYGGVNLPYQVATAAPLQVQRSSYGDGQPASGYVQRPQPGLPRGWSTVLPGQPPPSWVSNPQGGRGGSDPNQAGKLDPKLMDEFTSMQVDADVMSQLDQMEFDLMQEVEWDHAGEYDPNPPGQYNPNTYGRR